MASGSQELLKRINSLLQTPEPQLPPEGIRHARVEYSSLKLRPAIEGSTDGISAKLEVGKASWGARGRLPAGNAVLVDASLDLGNATQFQFSAGLLQERLSVTAGRGVKRIFAAGPVQMGSQEMPQDSVGIRNPYIRQKTLDVGIIAGFQTNGFGAKLALAQLNENKVLGASFDALRQTFAKLDIGLRIVNLEAGADEIGHGGLVVQRGDFTAVIE